MYWLTVVVMVIGPGCADQKKKGITEREICTTVTRVHVGYEDLAGIRMLLHVGPAGYA